MDFKQENVEKMYIELHTYYFIFIIYFIKKLYLNARKSILAKSILGYLESWQSKIFDFVTDSVISISTQIKSSTSQYIVVK